MGPTLLLRVTFLQLALSVLGYAQRGVTMLQRANAPIRRMRPLTMMPNSILEEVAEAAVCDGSQRSSAAATAECPLQVGAKRSVLVLGWFFAKDRELDYVRRMYNKNGFDDVVICPSKVGIISKPRGWYRSMRRQLQPGRRSRHEGPTEVEQSLGRHFDVVHCMSGGFLALYVLLRSRVGLRFSTLLCDSTPILPKPAAFTRFARAYLESVGLKLPLRMLPARLHQACVQARWWVSIFYIKTRHRVLNWLGRLQGEELNRWASGPVEWGLSGDYDRVAKHALGTIYEGAAQCDGAEIIFLYNPNDPFLDPADVSDAAQLAREVGLAVREVETKVDHIKALFSSPRTVFNLLRPTTDPAHDDAAEPAASVAAAAKDDLQAEGAAEETAGLLAAPPAALLAATAQKATTLMKERIDSLVFTGSVKAAAIG